MLTARRLNYSYVDYLRLEAESPTRHEFYRGEIFAMAGGTLQHSFLAGRLIFLLGQALPRCQVGTADGRVRVEATGLSTYPDVSVVCGAIEASPIDPHALINPVLLAEVTSPSTEDYDRGEKLSQYQQIASLQFVLLVSYDKPSVTLVERTLQGWNTSEWVNGTAVPLGALEAAIEVAALYPTVQR